MDRLEIPHLGHMKQLVITHDNTLLLYINSKCSKGSPEVGKIRACVGL